MIYGPIDHAEEIGFPLCNPVWTRSLAALQALHPDSQPGITEFEGGRHYLNVHTYETKPLEQCRYEGHRDMIDVQYMIRGGELIEWVLKDDLEEDGPYLSERDFQYYHRPAAPVPTRVRLAPGHFGIFFPEDGHCPKIHDGVHDSVFKAVVKIHRSLLEG